MQMKCKTLISNITYSEKYSLWIKDDSVNLLYFKHVKSISNHKFATTDIPRTFTICEQEILNEFNNHFVLVHTFCFQRLINHFSFIKYAMFLLQIKIIL